MNWLELFCITLVVISSLFCKKTKKKSKSSSSKCSSCSSKRSSCSKCKRSGSKSCKSCVIEIVLPATAPPTVPPSTTAAPGGTSAAPGGVTGTSAAPGGVTGTSAAPGGVTGTSAAPGGVTGTSAAPGGVTSTSAAPSSTQNTATTGSSTSTQSTATTGSSTTTQSTSTTGSTASTGSILLSQGINWCNSTALRCGTATHVACNNALINGGFGSACRSASVVDMDAAMQQTILDVHNKYRNQQALGQTPNYGPAANMATMKWDRTLAALAELTARKCLFAHDSCRNTPTLFPAGQSLALVFFTLNIPKSTDPNLSATMASGWFTGEAARGQFYGNMRLINNLTTIDDGQTGHFIGHFTQYVQARANFIGCARTSYLAINNNQDTRTELLCCNYSHDNVFKTPVYTAGAARSGCTLSQINETLPGLCGVDEPYPAGF